MLIEMNLLQIPYGKMCVCLNKYIQYSWPLNSTDMKSQVHLYADFFFFFFCSGKYCSTTPSRVGWICGYVSRDTDNRAVWRADYKQYTDFQVHREREPLTPALGWCQTISMITAGKEVRTSGCGKTRGDIYPKEQWGGMQGFQEREPTR